MKMTEKNDFRKSFAIFQSRNKYLNKSSAASDCLRNDFKQIMYFPNSSTLRSHELTEMSANLRNYTFSENADPGVEFKQKDMSRWSESRIYVCE